MLNRFFYALLFLSVLLGSTVGLYTAYLDTPFVRFVRSPEIPRESSLRCLVMPGASMRNVVTQLEENGLMTPFQGRVFCALARWQRADKFLRAGEYAFSLTITPRVLLQQFQKGASIRYALTIEEGTTVAQLYKTLLFMPPLKKTLPLSWNGSTPDLEGSYFPDTYYFTAQMSDKDLLHQARLRMTQKLHNAWIHRDQNIVLRTPHEALILASIIEKEAAVSEERKRISAVFHNRLKKGMRLQADPTVLYGGGKPEGTRLTREDLRKDTPYNTYLKAGLPPTPIALPGMASIEAALHPSAESMLYFVAKGDGTHYFSDNLAEHNQAVLRYQRGD